ncbi:MAG TPA: hypothetical protein VNO70_22755 [Blastocatellia bacterium]|nr:hypothetical protein [Blastocatellia bacterium]
MNTDATDAHGLCPLCGEGIALDFPDWRVPAGWRDALAHRDKWVAVAAEFRARQSIEEAAQALAINRELAARLLDFLCSEVCGCRAVTCVSCLDDYRSEL